MTLLKLQSAGKTGFDPENDITWHSLMYSGSTDMANDSVYGAHIPTTSGTYIQTPDAAKFDITSDIGLVAKVACADWTPASGHYWIMKWDATANQRSYGFGMVASGSLQFVHSDDGTAVTAVESSVATGHTDGLAYWIGVSWDQSSGDTKFWTGGSGDTPSWSQLGSTRAGPTSAAYSSTTPVEAGSYEEGTAGKLTASRFEHVRIYDGIGANTAPDLGTAVAELDLSGQPTNAGRTNAQEVGTDAQSNTWTAYGTDWYWSIDQWSNSTGESDPVQTAMTLMPEWVVSDSNFNSQPSVNFDGTNDYLQSANFSAAISTSYSIVVVGRTDDAGAAQNQYMVDGNDSSHRNIVGSNIAATPDAWGFYAGNSFINDPAAYTTDPVLLVVTGVDGSTGSETLYKNGTSVASGDAGSQVLDGITLGDSYAATGTAALDGQILFVGVYAGDVTSDPQWSRFNTWLKSTYGLVTVDNFDVESDLSNVHSLFWAEGTAFSAQGLSDTDPVATWNNETGEQDATAFSGSATYDADHASFNNQPVLAFSSSEFSTGSFDAAPSYTSGVTIIVVAKSDVTGGDRYMVDGIGSTSGNYMGKNASSFFLGAGGSGISTGNDTNVHLFVGFFDGSTGNEKFTIDGTLIGSSNAGSETISGMTIGTDYNGGQNWTGDIALVIVIEDDAEVNDASWAVFEGWVESHYGITIA